MSLSLSESRGDAADMLDIVVNDADGRLAIPERGALLGVSFGWSDTGVVDKGAFTVDEVEHSGAPDILTIRARSASMTKDMGERKEASWHGETLGPIVRKIAGRHSLKPAIADALAKIAIAHIAHDCRWRIHDAARPGDARRSDERPAPLELSQTRQVIVVTKTCCARQFT
ncbi:phage protein D [Paraburkholderia sp. MM5384-R2]|nr:hypothetical protein [Paraburkholderia sp. MM5384-R2]MBB5500642.1 phage protein D [Paraburkholderia sp. MM5384-R2]